MILHTKKEPQLDEDYIDIRYREITPTINQIMELCKEGVRMISGEQDGKRFNIDINDVLYIEWVDNRSCICTSEDVFTTSQTLAQLQQQLDADIFIRVSKPILVNIYKIKWISSGLNMKLLAELINEERVAISRHYRDDLLNAVYALGKQAIR